MKKIDLFKLNPYLMINKEKMISSKFSQFLSIIFIIFASYTLVVKS